MRSTSITTLLLLLFSLCAGAQSFRPKYSNDFLAIGVGARAMAMSNSVVASSEDVASGYFNPAGLARLPQGKTMQVGLMHSEYFAGISKFDYAGFARRIDSSSVLALNVVRFGVDDIPNTLNLIDANGQIDYNRITTFSTADYAFLLSYSRSSGIAGLTYGGTVKVIRRIAGSFANAWGFGLDAGLQYRRGNWSFGLAARDITQTFNAWKFSLSESEKLVFQQTGNTIPSNSMEITNPRVALGGGYRFPFRKFSALVEANLMNTFDGYRNTLIKSGTISIDPAVGVELAYQNLVFVRGGIGNFQQVKGDGGVLVRTSQPNIGLGVRIKMVHVDYALANVGQQVGLLSHVFSLKVDLGGARMMP